MDVNQGALRDTRRTGDEVERNRRAVAIGSAHPRRAMPRWRRWRKMPICGQGPGCRRRRVRWSIRGTRSGSRQAVRACARHVLRRGRHIDPRRRRCARSCWPSSPTSASSWRCAARWASRSCPSAGCRRGCASPGRHPPAMRREPGRAPDIGTDRRSAPDRVHRRASARSGRSPNGMNSAIVRATVDGTRCCGALVSRKAPWFTSIRRFSAGHEHDGETARKDRCITGH
jgi:hypothetical protein